MNFAFRKGLYRPVMFAPSTPWTPASLPGLKYWVEGDVGVTHGTSPATVTNWTDQSPAAQGDLIKYNSGVTSTPIYNANPLNGLPTVQLQQVVGGGLQNANVSIGTNTNQFWCFAVTRYTVASPANLYLITWLGNGLNGGTDPSGTNAASAILLYFPSANTLKTYHNGNFVTDAAISQNTWAQMGSVYDGTNMTLYVNNTAGTPTAQNTSNITGPGTLVVGTAPNGGNEVGGDIAAFVFGVGPILSSDQNKLHTYWLNKWATG